MAKAYHVLAGLVRDLRNASRDAEGSATAAQLVDEFGDLLELLLDGGPDDGSVIDESDDDASRDDEGDKGDTGDSVLPEAGNVRAVVPRGARSASVAGGVREQMILPQTEAPQRQLLKGPRHA